MKRIKLGIIVEKYPVISQSFINRLIEELATNTFLDITIITIYPVDFEKLKVQAIPSYNLIESGVLKVKTFPSNSKLTMLKVLSLSFIRYLALSLVSKHFKVSHLFSLNIKFHAKAALLSYLVKRENFDIVHPQFMDIALYTVLTKFVSPEFTQKVFSTGRGADISKTNIIGKTEVQILEHCTSGIDKYFFVSKSLQDIAVRKGIEIDKCRVSYSGIDLTNFSMKENQRVIKKDKFKFIQVGRLVEKKGIMMTLNMFKVINEYFDAELKIVGDGPLYREAVEFVESNNLLDKVSFVGAAKNSQCIQLIRDCDLMLVPSLTGKDGNSEGIPNVAKEAMALGCIVIASKHSGIPELIKHSETGFLFDEGSIVDYVETVKYAIHKKDDWSGIALKARIYVEENFSIQKISSSLSKCYLE